MLKCICPFCTEPNRPMYSYTDTALTWLVQTTDDHHKRMRVKGYIELFYRAGVFDPMMPYRVWIAVMGTDVDPPFTKDGIGAFQVPRLPDGTRTDGQWWWWDKVGRQMPWSQVH
jgi:hypothetical protein